MPISAGVALTDCPCRSKPGADGDVAEFAAIGAGIHPQAAADRSRNADKEFQPDRPLRAAYRATLASAAPDPR